MRSSEESIGSGESFSPQKQVGVAGRLRSAPFSSSGRLFCDNTVLSPLWSTFGRCMREGPRCSPPVSKGNLAAEHLRCSRGLPGEWLMHTSVVDTILSKPYAREQIVRHRA